MLRQSSAVLWAVKFDFIGISSKQIHCLVVWPPHQFLHLRLSHQTPQKEMQNFALHMSFWSTYMGLRQLSSSSHLLTSPLLCRLVLVGCCSYSLSSVGISSCSKFFSAGIWNEHVTVSTYPLHFFIGYNFISRSIKWNKWEKNWGFNLSNWIISNGFLLFDP